MKAVVAAFNQEKALVGAFSVITNLRMELFQALVVVVGIGRQIAGRDGNCEVKVKFGRHSHRRLGAKKHSTFVTFREIKSKIFSRSASRHNSSELVNCWDCKLRRLVHWHCLFRPGQPFKSQIFWISMYRCQYWRALVDDDVDYEMMTLGPCLHQPIIIQLTPTLWGHTATQRAAAPPTLLIGHACLRRVSARQYLQARAELESIKYFILSIS